MSSKVSKFVSPKPDSKKITGQSFTSLDENENEEVSKKDVGKETGENEPIFNLSDGAVAVIDEYPQHCTNSKLRCNSNTNNDHQINGRNKMGQKGSPTISKERADNQQSAKAEIVAKRRSERIPKNNITKKFVLVKDEGRNYKEGGGGKGFGPQGRIIEENITVMKNRVPSYKGVKWRYVVAMNCKRGSIPFENVFKKLDQLISKKIAFVLGINEKVTMEHPLNYRPTWEELLTKDEVKLLKDTKIPILLIYCPWTTFREVKDKKSMTAYQVREQMFEAATSHPEITSQILDKWNEEDKKADHQFPFGPARNFLLNNQWTQKFISSLALGDHPVYIHVQDSDVVSFQETLMFTNFQNKDVAPLIPDSVECLLDKFDIVIDSKRKQNGFLPIFVGGAHVYSPDEDLSKQEITSDAAKYFTRFGTEMSNCFR